MSVHHAILDVDDVLVRTSDTLDAASEAMLGPLSRHLGRAQAAAVQGEFRCYMEVAIRRLRAAGHVPDDECADLMRRTARWQSGLTEAGFEVKRWSRHALVACALEARGLPVTAAVVDEAADRYWATVAARAGIYPDAATFVARLRSAGVALHLATGSDGFLTFDDARQTFAYVPTESARRKMARLRDLTSLGFAPDDVTVGDPVGKPDAAFCRLVLRRFAAVTGAEVDLAGSVVIGDSLTEDILPFLDLGVAQGVWLLRDGGARGGPCPPRVSVVRSLDAQAVYDVFSA